MDVREIGICMERLPYILYLVFGMVSYIFFLYMVELVFSAQSSNGTDLSTNCAGVNIPFYVFMLLMSDLYVEGLFCVGLRTWIECYLE